MITQQTLNGRWPRVPLGDLVQFLDHMRKPVTAYDRELGPYPYYGANGKQDSVAGYIFDEPLVLLAEDGGYFGDPNKTVAYRIEGKTWVKNHAHVLRPRPNVDINYLCRHLEKYDIRPFVSGTTRLKLTKGQAETIPIALPPLPEQRRIADILDKADGIRLKRQEAVGVVDSLISSEFGARFGDPVANTQSRKTVALSAYGRITTGNTPSRKEEDNYGDAIEWIKSDNINTPRHWLTRSTEGLSEKGLAIARTVPPGSTLVTCIAGSPSCVGNAAMADRTVAFNQQINAITPSERVDPFYLYALVLLSKPLIQRSSTESMKGMVSKGKFEQVEVIEADSREQTAFGNAFQKILALLDRQYDGDQESDNLFNSLVQRAFRGEL